MNTRTFEALRDTVLKGRLALERLALERIRGVLSAGINTTPGLTPAEFPGQTKVWIGGKVVDSTEEVLKASGADLIPGPACRAEPVNRVGTFPVEKYERGEQIFKGVFDRETMTLIPEAPKRFPKKPVFTTCVRKGVSVELWDDSVCVVEVHPTRSEPADTPEIHLTPEQVNQARRFVEGDQEATDRVLEAFTRGQPRGDLDPRVFENAQHLRPVVETVDGKVTSVTLTNPGPLAGATVTVTERKQDLDQEFAKAFELVARYELALATGPNRDPMAPRSPASPIPALLDLQDALLEALAACPIGENRLTRRFDACRAALSRLNPLNLR